MEKKTPEEIIQSKIARAGFFIHELSIEEAIYCMQEFADQETAELRAMCADKDREIERLNKENETLTILVNNPRYTPKGGF